MTRHRQTASFKEQHLSSSCRSCQCLVMLKVCLYVWLAQCWDWPSKARWTSVLPRPRNWLLSSSAGRWNHDSVLWNLEGKKQKTKHQLLNKTATSQNKTVPLQTTNVQNIGALALALALALVLWIDHRQQLDLLPIYSVTDLRVTAPAT